MFCSRGQFVKGRPYVMSGQFVKGRPYVMSGQFIKGRPYVMILESTQHYVNFVYFNDIRKILF